MGFQPPDYDPASRAAEQANQQRYLQDIEARALGIPIYFRKKKIFNLQLFTERELTATEAGAQQRGMVNMRDILRGYVSSWLRDPQNIAEIKLVNITIDKDFINVEYKNPDPIQDSKLITQLFRSDRFAGGAITRVIDTSEPEPEPEKPRAAANIQPYNPLATEFDPTPAPTDKKKLLGDGMRKELQMENQLDGPVQKAVT